MPREPGGSLSPEDQRRLEHIVRTARDAEAIVGDDELEAIEVDMVRVRALVNCFTEIGEAASRLSAQGRANIAEIPWRKVIGMRNLVVHVYWGVDIWELVITVQRDLPAMIAAIESALPG